MFVTSTSTSPAACAGVVQVNVVVPVRLKSVAGSPPNVTVIGGGATKPKPETVTLVPPSVVPSSGDTPVTTGVKPKEFSSVPDNGSSGDVKEFVTVTST